MLVVLLDSRNFRNHVKFKPISEHHGVGSAIHIKAGEYLKPETYMLKPIKQPKEMLLPISIKQAIAL